MKQNILICIDRDGTLIYDNHYYLGSQKNWKSKIRFLSYVIQGIKIINKKIPEAKLYMITNQTGIAIKNFPLLTIKRAHEVCKYIIKLLKNKQAKLDNYILCPHVLPSYAKRKSEFKFNKKFVCNCPCIKPNIGMIEKALKKESLREKNTSIYVIGDRASDVHTANNAKGFGILVPFKNEPGEKEKVKKLKHKNTYIAKDFLDAVKFIIKREK